MTKLLLVGFGVVGQGFAEILRDKAQSLKDEHGFAASIVGVATRSKGALSAAGGLDIDALLAAAQAGHFDQYPSAPDLQRHDDILRMIRESDADVMIETTYTDLDTAQPALDYCRAALESGKHVVLANKGPIALAYRELQAQADAAGRLLRFEGTVMSGTPAIRLAMQALAGCTIKEVRGILNGTTNYILTQMESGMSYADALSQAQALGYAEADPTADVEGWDAAAKAVILSTVLFGRVVKPTDLDVRGISQITAEDVAEAAAAGERWKLIARVTPDAGVIEPVRIPMSNPLAGVAGATNAITYVTDLLGEVTLVGAGAGRQQTGFALLSDVLDIARLTRG